MQADASEIPRERELSVHTIQVLITLFSRHIEVIPRGNED